MYLCLWSRSPDVTGGSDDSFLQPADGLTVLDPAAAAAAAAPYKAPGVLNDDGLDKHGFRVTVRPPHHNTTQHKVNHTLMAQSGLYVCF